MKVDGQMYIPPSIGVVPLDIDSKCRTVFKPNLWSPINPTSTFNIYKFEMAGETVIREVTKNVWTFSRPFARYGIAPIGGRSTAIKLQDSSLWVLASTPLDTETKSKLDELGPVKYIISPDGLHHLYLGEFKKAYPEAKVLGPAMAAQRIKDKQVKFDGIWGTDPPDTKYGFEPDIQACYFSGFRNKDVAFYHPESKTMIEADLMFNLPAKEQYSKSKSSGGLPFFKDLGPFSWAHAKMLSGLCDDKEAMKRDAKTVAGWNFERIIPCHGDVIETNAKEAWRTLYKDFLV